MRDTDTRTPEEAFTHMGAVVPVLIVVIFWMIVGAFSVALFRRWLRVPTEAEVEEAHEHGHEHEQHEAMAEEDKVEQAAAH